MYIHRPFFNKKYEMLTKLFQNILNSIWVLCIYIIKNLFKGTVSQDVYFLKV
jgi:hypothetical protein